MPVCFSASIYTFSGTAALWFSMNWECFGILEVLTDVYTEDRPLQTEMRLFNAGFILVQLRSLLNWSGQLHSIELLLREVASK